MLSPPRRRALIAWARDVDGYVIEDDYDAEYRYDRHPVGAMQGLAPDRVIYSGTLSKSLAPGLRLGWLVLPAPLVAPIAASRMLIDHSTSAPVQATFAEFLANGDLDRHLRRMRRVYRQRRDVSSPPSPGGCPTATTSGIAAGTPRPRHAAAGSRRGRVGRAAPPTPAYASTRSATIAWPERPTPRRRSCSATATCTPPAIEEGVRILAERRR